MSKRDIDRIISMFDMYYDGNSCTQIGKEYGISRQRVNQIIQNHKNQEEYYAALKERRG